MKTVFLGTYHKNVIFTTISRMCAPAKNAEPRRSGSNERYMATLSPEKISALKLLLMGLSRDFSKFHLFLGLIRK